MSNKFNLITTANQEVLEQSSHQKQHLLLGEWCKTQETIKKLNNFKTVEFLWDKKNTISANIYLNKIRQKIIKKIPNILNSYHNENNNEKYYFILLNYWLAYYIDQIYDKYTTIKYAFKNYEIESTDILDESQYYVPEHTYDFLIKTQSDSNDIFHFQLYSQIISFLYPKKFTNIELSSSNLNSNLLKINYGPSQNILKKLKLFYLSKIQKIFNANSTISIVDNFLTSKQKSDLQNKQKTYKYKYILNNFSHSFSFPYEIDYKIRKQLNLDLHNDEFEKLLSHLFFQHLPIIILEGYKEMKRNIQKMYIPKTTYYQGTLTGHHLFDFFYAQNQNIKTLQHQHGAGYGMIYEDYRRISEYKYADIFLSWGWNDTPLTHPKLVNKQYKAQLNQSYSILFAYSHQGRYIHALHNSYKAYQYMSEYLDIQKVLINNLKNHYKIDVLDCKHESSIDFRKSLENENCNFLEDEKFTNVIYKKNYIYISATSQTTILESLSCNIPSLVLLNNEIFEYSDNFKSIIPLMLELKIFHKNTNTLIKHLINIQDNPSQWWYSKKVQRGRKKFMKLFAHNNQDWIAEWIEFYKNLEKGQK